MKLGAIDVGSNAIRVLIAEVKKPLGVWQYSKIAYLRLPVRLGDDVFEKGKISDAKIEFLVFSGLISVMLCEVINDFSRQKHPKSNP